jgi:hypothetical protein
MVDVDETGKATFRFRHGTSGPVFLVGDFCHWQADHLPMRRISDHEWMLMLRLPPGLYEFRYYADEQWFTDYAAFGVNQNSFREFNSVLRVPKVRPVVQPVARPSRTSTSRIAASA